MRQSIVCKVCGSRFSEHWQLFEHATCEAPIKRDTVTYGSPGPPEENVARDLWLHEQGGKLDQLMTDLRSLGRPQKQEPPPESEGQA